MKNICCFLSSEKQVRMFTVEMFAFFQDTKNIQKSGFRDPSA